MLYGLTVPVTTYNPFRLQYGEFAAAFRDVRAAGNWHDRAGYLFAPPGWKPGDPTGVAGLGNRQPLTEFGSFPSNGS